jgi:hypothetical protein
MYRDLGYNTFVAPWCSLYSVHPVSVGFFFIEYVLTRLRVFENRVLRRIFGPKVDGVTVEWRKLHNELHDLYSSPSIIRIIKSRRMRWAGHVARRGRRGTRIDY